MTYSQRTIKDVNIALYINLAAPSAPQTGKRAGEKGVEIQSTLLEVGSLALTPCWPSALEKGGHTVRRA